MTDAHYMDRALMLAARGRGLTSPNPVVGAVIVTGDGVVVGQGFHARAGGPHAEVHALNMAGVQSRGATLYCTLEPCCHTGRTGPCVEQIADAGIARVVAAVEDPDPRVQGRGFDFLRSRGITVDAGVGRDIAVALNRPFFTLKREGRPLVTLKAAISLDGHLAESPGRRTALTATDANRHAQRIRAEVDVLAVGIGTILIDDPWLTARGVYRERPLTRVIFDRALRTPLEARVLSTPDAGPVMIVTTAEGASNAGHRQGLEAAGAEIVVSDGTVRAALMTLAVRGMSSVLLEGGAAMHCAAWDEGVVDAVRLYVTPHFLGDGGVRFLEGRRFSIVNLVESRVTPLGPDVMIEGYVHRSR